MSTQSVQPSMHFDSSMVTGTSARWGTKGMAVSRNVALWFWLWVLLLLRRGEEEGVRRSGAADRSS
ncbi:hypothetical protein GCM10010301_40770 [Streptomyces plicatus]|nr:hypothetical protein GCM10010301_40770 [Streptomyces plicatus]